MAAVEYLSCGVPYFHGIGVKHPSEYSQLQVPDLKNFVPPTALPYLIIIGTHGEFSPPPPYHQVQEQIYKINSASIGSCNFTPTGINWIINYLANWNYDYTSQSQITQTSSTENISKMLRQVFSTNNPTVTNPQTHQDIEALRFFTDDSYDSVQWPSPYDLRQPFVNKTYLLNSGDIQVPNSLDLIDLDNKISLIIPRGANVAPNNAQIISLYTTDELQRNDLKITTTDIINTVRNLYINDHPIIIVDFSCSNYSTEEFQLVSGAGYGGKKKKRKRKSKKKKKKNKRYTKRGRI